MNRAIQICLFKKKGVEWKEKEKKKIQENSSLWVIFLVLLGHNAVERIGSRECRTDRDGFVHVHYIPSGAAQSGSEHPCVLIDTLVSGIDKFVLYWYVYYVYCLTEMESLDNRQSDTHQHRSSFLWLPPRSVLLHNTLREKDKWRERAPKHF